MPDDGRTEAERDEEVRFGGSGRVDDGSGKNPSAFVSAFAAVQSDVHATAVRKGFWEGERNDGEMIALMHSELSEALEALRMGNLLDEKVAGFDEVTVELADCVIRIMDFAEGRQLRLAEAIEAKAAQNRGRAFRHGKAF